MGSLLILKNANFFENAIEQYYNGDELFDMNLIRRNYGYNGLGQIIPVSGFIMTNYIPILNYKKFILYNFYINTIHGGAAILTNNPDDDLCEENIRIAFNGFESYKELVISETVLSQYDYISFCIYRYDGVDNKTELAETYDVSNISIIGIL